MPEWAIALLAYLAFVALFVAWWSQLPKGRG
jgi:hypothetical protein